MNPIYQDKQELTDGKKAKVEDEDSNKYPSNYENDEFEDADLDDDFNLPADHQQNNEQYGQNQTNIKDQIHKNQQKVFANNGSQTNVSPKKTKNLEEQKQKSKSKV